MRRKEDERGEAHLTKTHVEQNLTTCIACYAVLQWLINNMGSIRPVFSQTYFLLPPLGYSPGRLQEVWSCIWVFNPCQTSSWGCSNTWRATVANRKHCILLPSGRAYVVGREKLWRRQAGRSSSIKSSNGSVPVVITVPGQAKLEDSSSCIQKVFSLSGTVIRGSWVGRDLEK